MHGVLFCNPAAQNSTVTAIDSHRGAGVVYARSHASGCARTVMGDADDSYDFAEMPRLLAKLREGNDLVQGCRLPAGGGTLLPGAMPFLHRWFGNPMFSALAR